MPSASDFLAASDLGGFKDEVELPVPPRGNFPELQGSSSEQPPKLFQPTTMEQDSRESAGRE